MPTWAALPRPPSNSLTWAEYVSMFVLSSHAHYISDDDTVVLLVYSRRFGPRGLPALGLTPDHAIEAKPRITSCYSSIQRGKKPR